MASFYDDASLALIPSGVKAGKVYSAKPTSGDGDLTFTRASSATRVGSDGLIEKVRTNLLLQSNSFDTIWSLGNSTLTANAGTSPSGANDAWKIESVTIGTETRVRQSVTTTVGVEYSFSCFMKAGNVNWGIVRNYAINAGGRAWFDLQNGVVGAADSGITPSIESVGNGWYQCSITGTATTSGSFDLAPAPANSDYTSNAIGDYVLIYGAQGETGDIATDYIATTSAAVSVGPVANLPRLDYSGGATCPRLLLEPQRTNVALYSEQFNNAAWTKVRSTITANNTTSPAGYSDADLLVADTSSNDHFTLRSATASTAQSFSVFAKAGGYDYVFVGADNLTTSGVFFNLTNGTISQNTSSLTAKIEDYGNGWYRCSVSSASWPVAFALIATSANGTALVHAGNGTSGVYLWGAQLEAGAYATSYIPTLGAAVTRGVDFGSSSDTIGTSYASSDFSYFIEFDLLQDSSGSNTPMLFGGGNFSLGASGQGYLRIGLSGNNSIILFGHGDSQMASVIYAFTKGTRYKLLVKRSGTSIKFYVNGAQVGATGTSSLDFTLRSIGWSYVAGTYNTYGNIYQFLAFQTALSDADAIALTA